MICLRYYPLIVTELGHGNKTGVLTHSHQKWLFDQYLGKYFYNQRALIGARVVTEPNGKPPAGDIMNIMEGA